MNVITKIETLFEKSEAAQIVAGKADAEFKKYLYGRVNRFHSIGRSVLKKSLGNEVFAQLNDRHIHASVSRELMWLIDPLPRISIRGKQGRQVNSEIIVGNYLLPLKLFQQSDRDFAKKVRTSLCYSRPKFEEWEYQLAKETIERIETNRKNRKGATS